ncbi:MAG: PLP-dependent decarboxylase [Candidatus Cloacimonetes bacterium]|nr:PLP-dependent decarboxylase [Candidatus Cloacimonadota bacterium]
MIQEDQFREIYSQQQGSTFVYDIDSFDIHLNDLVQSLPTQVKAYYATKANPLSSVIKCVNKNKIGIDVASIGEFKQALSCGVNPQDIIVTGPAKSKKHLEIYLKKGVNLFVIESKTQLYDLNELSESLDLTPRVLLRVQLVWPESGESVLGGNNITAFGLDIDQWQEVAVDKYSFLRFEGFHVFQWGNILDAQELYTIWKSIIHECQNLATQINVACKVIDFGGGWGIPYANGSPLDMTQVCTYLSKVLSENIFEEIYIELGRFAIGEFGYYMSHVIDRKIVRGKDILVLEGGMNHLIRPVLTNQSFPIKSLSSSKDELREFQLHGPLCSSLDTVGLHNLPDDTKIGDVLLFSQCGAYGFTESMPFFLCHDLPAEVIVKDKKTKILRDSVDASWWLR